MIINPNIIIKIYKRNKNNDLTEKKIKLMIDLKLNIRGICWPLEILHFGNRLGYKTYKATGMDLILFLRKPVIERYDFIDRKF